MPRTQYDPKTGPAVAQIGDDALHEDVPTGPPAEIGRLICRGPILVCPATGRIITQALADAALSAVREHESPAPFGRPV